MGAYNAWSTEQFILQDPHKNSHWGPWVFADSAPPALCSSSIWINVWYKGEIIFSVLLIIGAKAEPISRYDHCLCRAWGLVKILLLNSWPKPLMPALQDRGGLHFFPSTKNLLLINARGKSISVRPVTLKFPGRGGKISFKPWPCIQGNDLLWQNICSFWSQVVLPEQKHNNKMLDGTFMVVRCEDSS